jgi:hypothetical protein
MGTCFEEGLDTFVQTCPVAIAVGCTFFILLDKPTKQAEWKSKRPCYQLLPLLPGSQLC